MPIFSSECLDDIKKGIELSIFSSLTESSESSNDWLKAIYTYDLDAVMHKTESFGDKVSVPHSILHRSFVNLRSFGRVGVYLSELFSIKASGVYYLVGKQYEQGYKFFLYQIPIGKFVLLDDEYSVIGSVGYNRSDIVRISKQISLDERLQKSIAISIKQMDSKYFLYLEENQ